MYIPCGFQLDEIVSMIVIVAAAIVVGFTMVKVLLWTMAVMKLLVVFDLRPEAVIGMLASVEITFMTAVAIELGSATLIPFFNSAVIGVLAGVMPKIGVERLADAHGNIFASLLTALELELPKPCEKFCC